MLCLRYRLSIFAKNGFERKESLSDQDFESCIFTTTDGSRVSSGERRFD
jgi:hypothetical protein